MQRSLVASRVSALVRTREWTALVLSCGFVNRPRRFFSSYNSGATGWTYSLGQFAQLSLPLKDSATLTIQRVNSTKIETVTVSHVVYT